jgi:beta-glucosidase
MSELWPYSSPKALKNPELEQQIDSLLDKMSLEQKVGQMIQADIRFITPNEVGQYQIGSVLSGGGATPNSDLHASAEDWLKQADAYHEASKAAGALIPPVWGIDAVHGHNNVFGATIFPHNIGLGATRNPELIKAIAAATAVEVRATGLDWNFAPTLAVARDDRWGRTYESYGEAQEIVSSFAAPFVEGMQGAISDDFLSDSKVIATAKHFVGDGGTEGGEDQGNTRCDEKTLYRLHGESYSFAIAAGAQSVMASFNSWHGEKLHGHKYLLTDILKDKMGFDGVIVGDWNGHGQLPEGSNEDAAQAVAAGLDIIMVPEDWHAVYENLIRKVSAGDVSLDRIDDAVRRILRMKLRCGVSFDRKPSERQYSGQKELIGCEAHKAIARQAVRESAVLLKNENSVLPIKPGKRVLVLGHAADNIAQQCGGWSLSWQGDGVTNQDFPNASSTYSAVQSAVAETQGLLLNDISDAASADVAIVVFGEQPYAEGEGDRATLSFSFEQCESLDLLLRLKALGVPTISIFLSGRPMWVNPELNASDAFIAAWLPGSEAEGLADLIFEHRDFDFTGKLSFSWPSSAAAGPVNVGDTSYLPLFEYGYGLSLKAVSDIGVLDEVDDTPETPVIPDLEVFDRRPSAPFKLYAGDSSDWFGHVDRARFKSALGVVEVATADWKRQEDARKVTWSGGSGQILISADEGQDASVTLGAGGNLVIHLCVHEKPESTVVLRMDSEYPRSASLDITDALNALPVNEWSVLEFGLHQFTDQNFDPANVTSPFLIWTDGQLSLSFGLIKVLAPHLEVAAQGI